jgi:prolyl-tRNA synthetase
MATNGDNQANSKKEANAISPRRDQDYPEWYQQVIKASDMAEMSVVRGCMVIKPWGYGVWENIQKHLDSMIKATGHSNAYFPLFIPLSFLEKEAAHVEGFAKECAVVTHHRLEARDGKLVPSGELDEPVVVRPTSETIIGESFARWVQSYRDLPLLINQWANVVRWEMRTRIFLRTTEFLWQEGHTAHASEKEAIEETFTMLNVYADLVENYLAMPVIKGEKIPEERFPGAVDTYCIEAMMQDRKALQAGTSHYLGQNFAKASNISFLNQSGESEFAYTTSWGVSTRLIGGMIMTHSDDDGLRLPPKVAPKHVVIIPVVPKPEMESAVFEYAEQIAKALREQRFAGMPVEVIVDKRDIRGGDKSWEWIKKGIPVRIEVGPRDIDSKQVVMYRRDQGPRDKAFVAMAEAVAGIAATLQSIHDGYYEQAKSFLNENIRRDISTFEEFKAFFTPKNEAKPEIHGGFVLAKWSGVADALEKLSQLTVTVRCLPLEQSGTEGRCIITGRPATRDAIFAKAY